MFLEVKNLDTGYGKKKILYNVNLSIQEKEIIGIIGHNGAGKSTTLRCIFGLLPPQGGQINFMGQDITFESPASKIDMGIYHIPQDNFIFNDLSVVDNLQISFFTKKDQSEFGTLLEEIYEYFPVLKTRQKQLAGTLSGGERRLLGVGMGLLRKPKLLLIDEPSSGLSPVAFQKVVDVVQEINQKIGTAVLLVEQNVKVAFKISKRIYVMKAGQIILEETGEKLEARGEYWDLF